MFFLFPTSLFCENYGFLLIQANKVPPSEVVKKENPAGFLEKSTEKAKKTESDEKENWQTMNSERHFIYSDLSVEQASFLFDALEKAMDRLSVSLIGSGELFQNQNFTKEEIDLLIRYREATVASYLYLLSPSIAREAQAEKSESDFVPEDETDKEASEEHSSLEEGEASLAAEAANETLQTEILSEEEKEAKRIAFFNQLMEPEEQLAVSTLLAKAENQEFSSRFNQTSVISVVESVGLEKRDSLNQFHQIILRIDLTLHSFEIKTEEPMEKKLQIVLSGFKESEEEAFLQAVSFLPKQLMREISGYLVEKGESAVIEILDSNEMVVSLGSKEGIFIGKTFSLLTKKKGHSSLAVKGQLKAYKVEEDYCYCELLFLKSGEEILVGDRVEADPFIGLETQVVVGFMGSMLSSSDFKNDGLRLFEGQSQAPNHCGFFSENFGYIGVREVLNYGMNLIRPFVGFDFFLDGLKGSGNTTWNPEKVWLLGSIENEGFLYRRDFMGIIRPYVGFNLNWQLNRVTISPEMAIGFILGKRLDFSGESSSSYGVASKTDYAPIAGSAFQYFTFTSLLNIEVRLDRRFSVLFNAGYDGWLGNMFELKGKIKPERAGATPEDSVNVTGNDFLKYFDWQFFRIGVGFTVRY